MAELKDIREHAKQGVEKAVDAGIPFSRTEIVLYHLAEILLEIAEDLREMRHLFQQGITVKSEITGNFSLSEDKPVKEVPGDRAKDS